MTGKSSELGTSRHSHASQYAARKGDDSAKAAPQALDCRRPPWAPGVGGGGGWEGDGFPVSFSFPRKTRIPEIPSGCTSAFLFDSPPDSCGSSLLFLPQPSYLFGIVNSPSHDNFKQTQNARPQIPASDSASMGSIIAETQAHTIPHVFQNFGSPASPDLSQGLCGRVWFSTQVYLYSRITISVRAGGFPRALMVVPSPPCPIIAVLPGGGGLR